MKKLLFLVGAMFVVLMSSCGGGSTPSDKAKEVIGIMQDGNAEALADQLVQDEEVSAEEKAAGVALMQFAIAEQQKQNGKILDYKILNETISEDGTKAEVEVEFKYEKKDKPEVDKLKFELVNGEWKLSMGK